MAKRSYQITSEGKALIAKIRQERSWNKTKLNQYLQEKTGIETIPRILRLGKAEENSIDLIAQALGILPTDLVDPNELYRLSESIDTKSSIVDWRSVSKGMLDNLKRLTTEALTAGDGIRFDFDDVFVPLGVVERQQKTKRNEDDGAPDRGSELYEEKVTPITHKEFFEDVLLRSNTKKRIAVIGEAGAGKTTQLQKIGSWLLEKTDDIPVWISLTDLGAKSLREYLFENWVREASGEIESAPQVWKDSLGDAIKAGKVWLLLDGVDEMTVNNPLSHLSTQLNESWLKNVRVVLTCRVNVWDGGKNALTGFDVYRNLDFDYPDDVYKFIGKWFTHAPELSGSLTQALEQSGKERIRDMVKNPLRLTLLCYSWQLKQGELPETKAGLYEWFVEAFYKWNKGKAQIELSRSQQDELNRALGELAKRAIDGETSRFRLKKTFIENVFRDFDIDLFDIALKLNWLNEIGLAAEDPLETVYAFYHPSFQEYFAALAIDDWDFFLPIEHFNNFTPVKEKDYRIFSNYWKEVILFWIGRSDIKAKIKEKFIHLLIGFHDDCGNFYRFRSLCLATECLSELKKIKDLDLLLNCMTSYIFIFGADNFNYVYNSFSEDSKSILKNLNINELVDNLESRFSKINLRKLQFPSDKSLTNLDELEIAKILISISPSNQTALNILIELIENNTHNHIFITADAIRTISKSTCDFDVYPDEIVLTLIELLNDDKYSYILKDVFESFSPLISNLKELISNSSKDLSLKISKCLTNLNCRNKNNQINYQTSSTSAYLTPENISTIDELFNLFDSESGDKLMISFDFKKINLGLYKEKVVKHLENIISSGADLFFFNQLDICYEIDLLDKPNIQDHIKHLPCIASNLLEIDNKNSIAINFFIRLLRNMSTDNEVRRISKKYYQPPRKEWVLKEVDTIIEFAHRDRFSQIVSNLQGIIINPEFRTKDYSRYQKCHQIIFHCAKNMSYQSFHDAWYSLSDVIDIQGLESQLIDFTAIQEELDRNTDHPEIRCLVVDIRHLEQESDPNIIAKKLTNKIFNSIGRRIPVVQDVSCLERELLNLKLEPEFEKLAIALYGKSANEAIAQLCQSLTDSIQISPFTGGQTTQELIRQINAWRSEM